MHSKEQLEAIRALDQEKNPHGQLKFSRTVVHRKRYAPKGCVFFVVSARIKNQICTTSQLIRTENLPAEKEEEIKNELIAYFKEKFL